MLNIDEEVFNRLIHEFPRIITSLEKMDCPNKKCKENIINKLEEIRELLLEAINEETT